jgi:hypothetical protein
MMSRLSLIVLECCGSIATPEVPVPVTTMISEVYEAFKEANVSDASARKAAEAIAAYETRFAGPRPQD